LINFANDKILLIQNFGGIIGVWLIWLAHLRGVYKVYCDYTLNYRDKAYFRKKSIMRPLVIIIILFSLLLVVFALQNTAIVEIKLLFWALRIPSALLILISIAMGLIIGLLSYRCTSRNTKKQL
jgi:uncharacterized integral membrane protein